MTARSASFLGVATIAVACAGCDSLFNLENVTAGDAGCTGAGCLTVLADGETGATEIAVDGSEVIWTVKTTTGNIRACATDACAPRSMATVQVNPHGLLLDGSLVLWIAETDIVAVARGATDSDPAVVYDDFVVNAAFRHVGQRLYLSAPSHGLRRCDFEPEIPACLFASTLNDPVFETLESVLTVDPGGQLWGAGDTYAAVELDIDTEEAIRRLAGPELAAFAVGPTHVYGLATTGASLLFWPATALDGTEPAAITLGGTPKAMVLDGRELFIGEAEGRLLRVPLAATGEPQDPQVVAELPFAIQGMTATADRIYVAADGRIGWLSR